MVILSGKSLTVLMHNILDEDEEGSKYRQDKLLKSFKLSFPWRMTFPPLCFNFTTAVQEDSQ